MATHSLLTRNNLLALVRGSVGSTAFRHAYAIKHKKTVDLLRGGRLSCAFFVSTILSAFRLIDTQHLTVDGTVRDLEQQGWQDTDTPEPGTILIWEATRDHVADEPHRHIGFYLGNHRAISNSSKKRTPSIHHWTFGKKGAHPKRRIERMLRHPSL